MKLVTIDPFLCVGIGLLLLIILVINVYILAYWQHPDDKNQSYFAKFVIILGLQLSAFAVLMIPVDVANNAGSPECDYSSNEVYCGGLNTFLFWETMFCLIAFAIVGLIPFSTILSEESLDSDPKSTFSQICQFCSSLFSEFIVIAAFVVLVVPLYFFFGETSIPVSEARFELSDLMNYTIERGMGNPYLVVDSNPPESHFSTVDSTTPSFLKYSVSFPVYVAGLLGWLGWWMFSVFAGLGLTALPFDLICSFIWRPRILSPDELAAKEMELQDRTNDVLELTQLLRKDRQLFLESSPSSRDKRGRSATDRLEVNKLSKMVYVLERDVEGLRGSKNINKDYNPLLPYFRLFGGVFLACVSVLWILQIGLYMIPSVPVFIFLNAFLIWFDSWFPMFGDMAFALLSLYLLACTVKGCFKIGMQFLCIRIHPMEVGGTFVSSFLFNIGLILICTIPVVHFCVLALAGFSRGSDSFLIFNVQIRSLPFYSLFFDHKVFVWLLLLSSLASIPYFLWRPREVAPSVEEVREKMNARAVS